MLFFFVRLYGGADDCTAMCRRVLHSIAQKLEEMLESRSGRLFPVTEDDTKVTIATKSIRVVRWNVLSNRFLDKRSRGIVTLAAGGIDRDFYQTEKEYGQGLAPFLLFLGLSVVHACRE